MSALIPHIFNNFEIAQRRDDGYLNATAACKAAGKLFADYFRLETTKAFLEALSTDMGIPISELIQTIKGGNGSQGTWVHPQVAIHHAQWLSPKFAVAVSKWVFDWLGGDCKPAHKIACAKPPKAKRPHKLTLSVNGFQIDPDAKNIGEGERALVWSAGGFSIVKGPLEKFERCGGAAVNFPPLVCGEEIARPNGWTEIPPLILLGRIVQPPRIEKPSPWARLPASLKLAEA